MTQVNASQGSQAPQQPTMKDIDAKLQTNIASSAGLKMLQNAISQARENDESQEKQ